MTTPYTYCITHKITGKKYYGARYAKGCHPSDLWVKYFTSSTIIKRIISEEGKDVFDYEVRKIFNSQKECVRWERKVLIRLGVPRNPKYLNKYSGLSLTPEEMQKCILEKYGVTHQSKLDSVKEQKIKKSLERYGVKYPLQSKEVSDKRKQTMISRYGHENPSQCKEFKDRIKEGRHKANENKKLTICPKCGYSCKSEGNMIRYHFDNCKHYKIKELHSNGMSPSEIGKLVTLDRHSVSKYLQHFNIKPNLPNIRKTNPAAKNLRKVIYADKEYESILSLARFLNTDRYEVYRMIKRGEVLDKPKLP